MKRAPFDLSSYTRRARSGPCFIGAYLAGDEEHQHVLLAEDEAHVAFLDRYPTLPGKVIAAPKAHVEHVVSELSETAYLAMMSFVRRVALAVEASVPWERTYLLSLGSQQGNAHVHWHIAPLPPGVPYEEQQFHALMAENGVLHQTPEQLTTLAQRIRDTVTAARDLNR